MSSPSDWLRADRSSPGRRIGTLLTTHILVMARYRPRWLMVAIRVRFMVWGLPTAGHILRHLCLELTLLGPMWRISVIRCMHRMNQCRSSSRWWIRGTWSCMSDTRRRRSNGCSTCYPQSRGWWLYTTTLSRCGMVVHHSMHSLYHLHILHTTTKTETWKAFRILTTINIRSF